MLLTQQLQGASGAAAAGAPVPPAASAPQAQQPQQPQPAVPAAGAMQFGHAPPGIDPAMWASLDAATASAIQAAMFGADSDDGAGAEGDGGTEDGASS